MHLASFVHCVIDEDSSDEQPSPSPSERTKTEASNLPGREGRLKQTITGKDER
jgi:hypothetical protein